MPSIQFLKDRAQRIINDKSYDQELDEMFNIAVRDISSSEIPLILLPQTETDATVQTGENILTFSAGSTTKFAVGDTITQGSATATATDVIVTSGTFATTDAVGIVSLKDVVGTYAAGSITSSGGGTATIVGDVGDPIPCILTVKLLPSAI